LEEEVVKNRKEMDKFKELYLQNIPSIKASAELNDILSKQISTLLKTGLGYVSGSSSKQPEIKRASKYDQVTSQQTIRACEYSATKS
jgi:hypothetical protein